MNKKRLALLFFFSKLIVSTLCHTHIDAAVELNLVGNRHAILVFDAYRGYSLERNQQNAVIIAAMMRNFAKNYASESVHLSYEDPAIYDLGNLLKSQGLPLIAPYVETSPPNKFFSILAAIKNGLPIFDVMAFLKPEGLTTYLAGDLTRVLAVIRETLPSNLTVRSNDPRREHYLALTNSKEWLRGHKKNIRMKSLITASPLLEVQRKLFRIDASLTTEQKNHITKFISDFAELEQQQLETFSSWVSNVDQSVSIRDLDQSIHQLEEKISLDDVHQFLFQRKQTVDVYSDAPLVDILLTMFDTNHPDHMMIILGNHLATKLLRTFSEMDLIIDGRDIPNVLENFTHFARNTRWALQ